MPGTIAIKIAADAGKAVSEFKRTADAASGLGKKVGGLGSIMKTGLAVGGIAAGVKFVFDSFSGAVDAEKVTKLLNNQVKNLGPAGKAAFKDASEFAQTFGDRVGIDDDRIKGVAVKLASFPDAFKAGSLGASGMERSLKAAFDLEAIGIGTAESNVLSLGKAMNSPVSGMSALTKSGVSFSAEQKAQIKNYMKHNQLAKAQAVLLQGIESNAKNAAEAAASPMQRMKVIVGNIGEGLAGKVLPSLNTFVTLLITKIIPKAQELVDKWGPPLFAGLEIAKNILSEVVGWLGNPAVQTFVVAIGAAVIAFETWAAVVKVVTAVQAIWNAVTAANSIMLIVIAVAALVAGIIYAYTHFETFRNIVDTAFRAVSVAFGWVSDAAQAVFGWISSHWELLTVILTGGIGAAVILIVKHFSDIRDFIVGVYDWITGHWQLLLAILTGPIGLAVLAIKTHLSDITGFFSGAIDWIKSAFSGSISWLVTGAENIAKGAVAGLTAGAAWIWSKLVDLHLMIVSAFDSAATWLVSGAASVARGVVSGLTAGAAWIWQKMIDIHLMITDAFDSAASWLVSAGAAVAHGIVSGLSAMAGTIGGMVRTVVGWLVAPFATAGQWLISAGAAVISGLLGGAKSIGGSIAGFVHGIAASLFAAGGNWGHILWDAGLAVIRGLGGGIHAMIGWVIQQVKNVAGAIWDAIKKLLGIGSPSRIAAGYGEQITLGLGQGVLSAVPQLRRSLSTVAGVVTSGLSASPSVALGAGVGGRGTTIVNNTITVQVPLGASAEETARQISNVLDTRAALVGR